MIRINNTQYIHFLQQADALRRSGSLCDAIISVKSQTFRAHRLVLACASRRLAQHLAQADTESPVHCTLECFSPHTFQQVLDFTYTQTLEVTVDDLHLLLRAAQLLEMQPLEDQCRKQLGNLADQVREEAKRREITCVKEENDPINEEKLQEISFPEEEPRNRIVIKNISTSETANGPPSTRKKAKLSVSATYNRDSVITRPASSASSFSPPWTLPANMWSSVSTWRRIAGLNYSSLIAAHSLQSPNQSSVAYPFSLSTPHLFPLLGSHFQTPVHSSGMGFPGFYPPNSQTFYTGSTAKGSIIKQGLLRRKKSTKRVEAAQTSELSEHDVPKASRETDKDCQHCSTNLHVDPNSTSPGARCQFCGRGTVAQHEPQEARGEKPYQCHHCPKKFSLKHQLDTHHRVHTGEKPFECRLCGQRSRDYSAMIKHLRTHGGATPYQCTVCLEFCNSLVSMQRHIKSHTVQDFPPGWTINSTYLYNSHI